MASTKRLLPNWLDSYMEYTDGAPAPEVFRRWTGYSILAGAMERRMWVDYSGRPMYPNMAIALVARPGIGKNMAIETASDMWRRTGVLNIAPHGMTKAALIDTLCEVPPRPFLYGGYQQVTTPLQICAAEFGSLFPKYDLDFMSLLVEVYDCQKDLKDKVRHKGKTDIINKPHMNLLLGTQPSYLKEVIPEMGWGQGFMSRLVMIHSSTAVTKSLFNKEALSKTLFEKLVKDLKVICDLVGPFKFEKNAAALMEDWNIKRPGAPPHPKLENYAPRRLMHITKLLMVLSISENNKMVIKEQHFLDATSILYSVEARMPMIFKEMAASEDSSELTECHNYMFHYCKKKNVEAIPEHILTQFMTQRVSVNRIQFFLSTMLNAEMMKNVGVNMEGMRKFKPLQMDTFYKETDE